MRRLAPLPSSLRIKTRHSSCPHRQGAAGFFPRIILLRRRVKLSPFKKLHPSNHRSRASRLRKQVLTLEAPRLARDGLSRVLLLVHDSAAMLRHGSYGRLSRLTLLTNGSRGYHLLHVSFVLFYLHLKMLLKPGVNVSSMDRIHSRIAFAAVSSSHRLPTTMAT